MPEKDRIWALVTDGVRARVLRGLETDANRATEPADLMARSREAHLERAMARTVVRVHGGQQAIDRDRAAFAVCLARLLDSHRLAGDFTALAVFAPPAMLKALHDAMSPPMRARVMGTMAANLIPLGDEERRRQVQSAVQGMRTSAPGANSWKPGS